MNDYQPFPISNFRTGLDEALEPWLIPRDAWQRLVNAHLYRGVVEKIQGYNLYANMSYRRIVVLSPNPDGVETTFTATLTGMPPTTNNFYGQAEISAGVSETWQYNGDGTPPIIDLASSGGGEGTLNTSTGALSLTFNTAPTNSTYNRVIFAYDSAPATYEPIMGIKPYFMSSGGQQILIFDTRRVGFVVGITSGIIAAVAGCTQGVSEIPHQYMVAGAIVGNGSTTTFSGTTAGHPIQPGTVLFTETDQYGAPIAGANITDDGANGLVGSNVTSGSINYFTGAWTVTFTVEPASGNRFNLSTGIYGNLFSGTFQNFFSVTNYTDDAFITNNVDPPVYYNGTEIEYVPTNLTVGNSTTPKVITASGGVPVYDITRALHNITYRDRLVYLSPTILGVVETSTAAWSTVFQPLLWTNDESEDAPTSEPIYTWGLINNDLIVRFANSERILRYTADAFAPFRWDSTNNLFHCDAAFSAINYDSYISSVGRPAIVASDGVNVKRADEIIPDFTFQGFVDDQTPIISIDQTSIGQCYGERLDLFKEGWLCYKGVDSTSTGSVQPADSVLAFNYFDGTYAVYQFPFSVLGYGRRILEDIWATDFQIWEDDHTTWNTFAQEENAIVYLGGDQGGSIWELGTGYTLGTANPSNPNPVLMDIISKNFNPFIEEGDQARLGYVDFFFSSFDATTLRIQFYINDELYQNPDGSFGGFYQETIVTLPGNNQGKIWKRIYSGAIGKAHTIRIYQNIEDFTSTTLDQPIRMHAMVPWFKSAGRVFT